MKALSISKAPCSNVYYNDWKWLLLRSKVASYYHSHWESTSKSAAPCSFKPHSTHCFDLPVHFGWVRQTSGGSCTSMNSMLMLGNNPQERQPKMPSLCYFISSYLIQCMVSATNGLLQVNAVIHVQNKKLVTTWQCVGVHFRAQHMQQRLNH